MDYTIFLPKCNECINIECTQVEAEKVWRQRWKGTAEDEIDSNPDSMGMNLNKLPETVKDRETWLAAAGGAEKSQKWLSDLTTATQVERSDGYRWHTHIYGSGSSNLEVTYDLMMGI